MKLTDDRSFDLLITRSGARHKAIVVDAPEGEARVGSSLPKVNL